MDASLLSQICFLVARAARFETRVTCRRVKCGDLGITNFADKLSGVPGNTIDCAGVNAGWWHCRVGRSSARWFAWASSPKPEQVTLDSLLLLISCGTEDRVVCGDGSGPTRGGSGGRNDGPFMMLDVIPSLAPIALLVSGLDHLRIL